MLIGKKLGLQVRVLIKPKTRYAPYTPVRITVSQVVRNSLPSTLLTMRTNIGTVRLTTLVLLRKRRKVIRTTYKWHFWTPSILVRITFWFVLKAIRTWCQRGSKNPVPNFLNFCKKVWCCLVFNLFFLLFCCKQGLMAEAEVLLSFVIFWFNLLIWSHSFGVRVEARSTLRSYRWNCESHEVNEQQ